MLLSGGIYGGMVTDYLSQNGATIFAKELRSRPQLKRLLDESRMTMIIAPSDAALEDVASSFGQSVAEFLASSQGEDVLSNHLSIVPTQKVYPLFTSINGLEFGHGPQDLAELQPAKNTVIGKVPIIVVNRAIVHANQEPTTTTFNQLTRDPLWLILERTDPMGVLNSCQTTPALAKLCRDPNTFRRLMQLHYPNYPVNRDARKQYTDITLKNGWLWYAIVPINDFSEGLQDGDFAKETSLILGGPFAGDNIDEYIYESTLQSIQSRVLEQDSHREFEVAIIKFYGTRPDNHTQFWVPVRFTQSKTLIHGPYVVNYERVPGLDYLSINKEDVAHRIAEQIVKTSATPGMLPGQANPNSKALHDYVFDRLMENNYFWESLDNEEWGWGLIQLTFN